MLHILGVEESSQFPCVQNGVITQSGNAGYMINQVLKFLGNHIGQNDLPTAFVTVGGRSVQVAPVCSRRDQVRRREISQALLEDMERECKQKIESHNPDVAVLGLIPSYYVLDGEERDTRPEPYDRAVLVEVHYIAFVGRKDLETQLQKSFDQAGKSIEKTFVRPEALLSAFACEDGYDVLREGCAVLDLGAQTTTLTVFKGSEYLLHKVVPQGGYHITRVIEQQGINMSTAEKLKTEYGYASADQVEKNLRMRIPAVAEVGELVITSEELAYTISMKLEEIINPLMAALKPFESRIRTLYITGGGSMLRGIDVYLQQKTSIRVLYGAHDRLLDRSTDEKYLQPTYSALVGSLIMGADYRDEHKGELVKEPTGWSKKLQDLTMIIFTDEQ